jgi:hydroxyacylglutathione hydrolase
MNVIPVACLRDNYAYLVVCDATRQAAVVDPSEAEPVAAALRSAGVTLAAILCTHHHADHTGGVEELLAQFGSALPVYGHARDRDRIAGLSRGVVQGDTLAVGALGARVLEIPAHTLGAVAYAFDAAGAVFTGDTLFCAGCGRLFEGTAAMMHRALNETLAALPDATRVYPGHEYAESNLRFAVTVEPGNEATRARYEQTRAARAAGRFCVPSTLGEERATNPFMRVREPEVRAFARERGADERDPVAVLGAVRAAKDSF